MKILTFVLLASALAVGQTAMSCIQYEVSRDWQCIVVVHGDGDPTKRIVVKPPPKHPAKKAAPKVPSIPVQQDDPSYHPTWQFQTDPPSIQLPVANGTNLAWRDLTITFPNDSYTFTIASDWKSIDCRSRKRWQVDATIYLRSVHSPWVCLVPKKENK